jgi:Glycosyl transferases group 1
MRVRIIDPGRAQYGVLNLFADQLGEAYQALGHTVAQEGADLTLSFTTLPERCQGIQLLVDHPLERQISPGATVGCVDRTHIEAVTRYFGDHHRPFFLPHAGCCLDGPGDPYADRDIDILFSGGFEDPRPYALEIPTEPLDLEHARTLFHPWDRHQRFSRREQVLRALGQAGIAVDVWGMGWDQLREREPHRFHDPVPFDQILALYRRAKVVLHVGPNFPCGSHERVFSAMMAGAAVLCDRNPYWEETLTGRCAMYDLDDLPSLARALLNDRGRRTALAAAGRAEAFASHTWMVRIRSSALLQSRDRRS